MVNRIKCSVLLVSCVAAAFLLSARAEARVDVMIGLAPPPLEEEVIPPPRVGYAWAPGYWQWDGRRHIWVAGHWIDERPGYFWVPDRWDDWHGRWHYRP